LQHQLEQLGYVLNFGPCCRLALYKLGFSFPDQGQCLGLLYPGQGQYILVVYSVTSSTYPSRARVTQSEMENMIVTAISAANVKAILG